MGDTWLTCGNLQMERVIQLATSLPNDSKIQSKLTGTIVKGYWDTLQHPPLVYLGDENEYRTPDGSNNVSLAESLFEPCLSTCLRTTLLQNLVWRARLMQDRLFRQQWTDNIRILPRYLIVCIRSAAQLVCMQADARQSCWLGTALLRSIRTRFPACFSTWLPSSFTVGVLDMLLGLHVTDHRLTKTQISLEPEMTARIIQTQTTTSRRLRHTLILHLCTETALENRKPFAL